MTRIFSSTAARLLAIALFYAIGLSQAGAGVISYSSAADFDAAFPAATVEDWEGFPDGTVFPNGTTVNGISYTASAGSAQVTDQYASFPGINQALGKVVDGFFLETDTVTFGFAAPVMAFGIQIFTNDTSDGGFKATTDGGDEVLSHFDPFVILGSSRQFGQFVGFSSDTAFSSVTISSLQDAYVLDNLRYVPAGNPIPEPASLAIFGFGALGALCGARRRRRRRTA